MKKLFFVIAVFAFIQGRSQLYLPVDSSTNLIALSKVISFDSSYSADILYSIAKEWFFDIGLKIQQEDQTMRKLAGVSTKKFSSVQNFAFITNMKILCDVKVATKKSKLKIECTNYIYYNYEPGNKYTKKIVPFNANCPEAGYLERLFKCNKAEEELKELSEYISEKFNHAANDIEQYIKIRHAKSKDW